jgi:hypothetical protein
MTVAGPAPSSLVPTELAGTVALALGNTAVKEVLLTTLKLVAVALPTWTLATSALVEDMNPDPVTVTE